MGAGRKQVRPGCVSRFIQMQPEPLNPHPSIKEGVRVRGGGVHTGSAAPFLPAQVQPNLSGSRGFRSQSSKYASFHHFAAGGVHLEEGRTLGEPNVAPTPSPIRNRLSTTSRRGF